MEKIDKQSMSPWIIAIVVMFPTAIELLDSSIANVVLPNIAGSIGESIDKCSWIITTYLVANAIILPITGWLADIIGRKRYLIISVSVFTISSYLCGNTHSLNELLIFRALQGVGGGGLIPTSQSILLEHFKGKKRSVGMAIYGMGIILAPIFGPMLGGYIADNYYWGWIFFINVPIGAISILLIHLVIEKDGKNISIGNKNIDYIGLATLAIGIGSLQIMLDRGNRLDWFDSNLILLLFVISLLSLSFAIFWELRQKDPVLKLKLLNNRNFAISIIVIFIIGWIFYGVNVAIPLFLQTLKGYTAFLSGEVIGVAGTVMVFSMPIAGKLGSKYDNKKIIIIGWIIAIVGIYMMTKFDIYSGFWDVVIPRAIMSFGISMVFVSINVVAFAFIENEHDIHYGTGFINLMRNIGGSIGISFLETVVSRRSQLYQNQLISHITPLNKIFQYNYITINSRMHLTPKQTLDIIYIEVKRQAAMLGYLDGFRYFLIISIITASILFSLKGKKYT